MRLLVALLCVLSFPIVGTAISLPAHAGGPEGRDHDYLAQLSAEELGVLKKKIPTWDQLDKRKQNRIAMHVLHLRDMDPAERERFKERMRRMRERKQRQPEQSEGRRSPSVFMAVFGQAIESMLAVDWPEGLKLADERKWSRSHLVGSFLRHKLMKRIGEFELERVLTEDFDVAAQFPDLSQSRRKKLEAAIERARGGDRRARQGLGRMLFQVRMHKFRGVAAQGSAQVAAQVREIWSKPYQAALDDVRGDIGAFAKRVETPRGSRGPVGKREWAALAWKLEEAATRTAKDNPALARDAEALFRRILREQLKVPADKLDALPARGTPMRRRALIKLLAMGRGDGRENHFGRGGPRRRPNGWVPGGARKGRGAAKGGDGNGDPGKADK